MSTATLETYWTITQVAERVHVSTAAVKKWLERGRLEKTKAGGRTLISESALQRFIVQSTQEPHENFAKVICD